MITSLSGPSATLLRQALSQRQDLPQDGLAALKNLLATANYQGKPLGTVVRQLNQPVTHTTPANPPRVPRTTCTLDEFSKFLVAPTLKAAQSTASDAQGVPIAQKYDTLSKKLLPLTANMTSIDLTSTSLADILTQMVTDGLITQDEVTTFTTVAAPDTTVTESDFEALAGVGKLAEADDVRQALGATGD